MDDPPRRSVKVCVLCHEDCSDRPRVKDSRGRYYCSECVRRRQQQRLAHASAAGGGPPAGKDEDEEQEARDERQSLYGTGEFEPPARTEIGVQAWLREHAAPDVYAAPDEDEYGEGFELAPEEPDPSRDPRRVCPECYRRIPPDMNHCVGCGYKLDEKAAPAEPPAVRAISPDRLVLCPHCGFDLQDTAALKCPNCGAEVDLTQRFKGVMTVERPRNRLERYMTPIMMTVAGIGGVALIHTLRGNADLIPTFSLAFGIQAVVGVAVLWACVLLWIGSEDPFPLRAIRFIGVLALVQLLMLALTVPGWPVIYWVIPLAAHIYLLRTHVDLDTSDATVVGLLTFGVMTVFMLFVLDGMTILPPAPA